MRPVENGVFYAKKSLKLDQSARPISFLVKHVLSTESNAKFLFTQMEPSLHQK